MVFDVDQLSRNGKAPFSIELPKGHTLQCLEIIRRVPGKRVVIRGLWDKEDVYAKVFVGPQAQRYASRDKRGIEALAGAGIPSPPLLYAGPDARGAVEVLVFQAIGNSNNAESVWEALPTNSEERLNLAKKLVATVAAHHKAGLMQTDLYLKNFLLKGEQVFTLDGDAIRRLPVLFTSRTTINNLALLFSKFDVMDEDDWLPILLSEYAREREWPGMPAGLDVQKRIAAIRSCIADKYADHKVFRECTDIKVTHSSCRFEAVSRFVVGTQLDEALTALDRMLDEAQLQRLKSGNTCTVGLTEIDGRKVVVKRYNIKSFWHGLSRALRQSRAAVSWSNAHRLQMHQIATAAPIALLEKRCGFIRRQAYYLAEYVDGPDIHEFLANADVDETHKKIVVNNVAQLFYKLNLLGISHGDFKATNVKVVGNGPLLIDLDSMRSHRCRWIFEQQHVRDLRRFIRNWQQEPQTKALLVSEFTEFYKDPQLLQRAGWV